MWFPAGTYASYSIHLKSNVALYLDQGATILAADPPPAGTPGDIVNRYNRDVVATLTQTATRDRLAAIGMDTETNTPEQFASYIRAEIAKWAPVVKASGARVD